MMAFNGDLSEMSNCQYKRFFLVTASSRSYVAQAKVNQDRCRNSLLTGSIVTSDLFRFGLAESKLVI